MNSRLISLLGVAMLSLHGFADVTASNFTLTGPDNGSVTLSWTVSGSAGGGIFGGWQYLNGTYNVAVSRGTSSTQSAQSRTVVGGENDGAYMTQQNTNSGHVTDTPPATGQTYYYWLHYAPYSIIDDTENFFFCYLGYSYSTILSSPCIGPISVFVPAPGPTKFTVVFHSNDGGEDTTDQEFEKGVSKALKKNGFSRSGYEFQGWSTSPDGGVEYEDEQEITIDADLVLYAVWERSKLRLSASDGTVPGGIEVEWTDDGTEQYSLYRALAEDGPFTNIATVATNVYFDTSVEWGRPYWYFVNRASGQKRGVRLRAGIDTNVPPFVGERDSNTDDGNSKSDGELPKITKIDVPKFWLLEDPNVDSENKFRIKWNDFDVNQYRVSGFRVTAKQGTQEIGPFSYPGESDSLDKRWNNSVWTWPFEETWQDLESGQIIERKKINSPGAWCLSISWTVEIIERDATGNVTGFKPHPKSQDEPEKKQTVEVFFKKYENEFDTDAPNWHYWWRQPGFGSIAQLKEFKYNKQLEDEDKGGACGGSLPGMHFACENPPTGYPRVMILGDYNAKYEISNLAPTVGTSISKNTWGYIGKTVGADPSTKGIQALAAVISHEREHGRLKENLYQGKDVYLVADEQFELLEQKDGQLPEIRNYSRNVFKAFTNITEMLDCMEKEGFNKIGASEAQQDYYNLIVQAKMGASRTDLDADGIIDSDEAKNELCNPDTYGFQFAYAKNATEGAKTRWRNEYMHYGDNEMRAREAESSPVECTPDEDWAIPGTKKLPELSGLSPTELSVGDAKATYDAELANSSFTTRQSVERSVKKSVVRGVVNADGHTYSGVATSVPSVTELTDGESVRVLAIVPQVPTVNADGLFDALRFSVVLTNRQDYAFNVSVKGYLADNTTNAIAWATSYIDLPSNGVANVNLVFDGKLIGSTASQGYSLRCLTVKLAGSDYPPLYCAINDAGVTSETFYSRQFAKYEAQIRKDSVLLRVVEDTTSGLKKLVASCEVESDSGLSYQLFGRLERTNCVMVSEARSEWFTIIAGCEKVEMEFDGGDLYLSGIKDEPLNLYTLALVRNDGTVVDSTTKAAMSPMISGVEFRTPDNAIDIIDEAVPNVVRGKDGKPDLITFSVAVVNVRSEDVSCRTWATLADTNGNICATAVMPCTFVSGTNHVVISFRGADISSSNVDGPYMLDEIRFKTSAGVVMCYGRPRHAPIDLKASDFGGVPFALMGMPVFRRATGKKPAALLVPVDVARPDTITASAMLTDGEGKYVAMARTNETVGAVGNRTLTLTFDPDAVTASGRRGPYTISYLLLKSGIEGVEDIRVEDFELRNVAESALRAFAIPGDIVTTETTPVPVERTWLDGYPAVLATFGGDYEAMANASSPGGDGGGKTWPDGSPYYMWQDFVSGTSPTNDNVFKASVHMEGNVPVVTWEPDTPELRATRMYRTFGKKTLLDAGWTDITDKDQSEYRFFKVKVEMP